MLLKSGQNGIVVTSNRIQADPTACSQEGSDPTRQSRIENWYETRGHSKEGPIQKLLHTYALVKASVSNRPTPYVVLRTPYSTPYSTPCLRGFHFYVTGDFILDGSN